MNNLNDLLSDDEETIGAVEELETAFPIQESFISGDDVEVVIEPPKKKRGRPKKEEIAKTEAVKTAAVIQEEDDNDDEVVVEPPKKKRGRPSKKEVVDIVEEEEKPIQTKVKPKKINLDEIPKPIIRYIYQHYSLLPLDQIAEKCKLPEQIIEKIIIEMQKLFHLAVTLGDLKEELYKEIVLPQFKPYIENNITLFVKDQIELLNK